MEVGEVRGEGVKASRNDVSSRVIGPEATWGDKGWKGIQKYLILGRHRLWMVPKLNDKSNNPINVMAI